MHTEPCRSILGTVSPDPTSGDRPFGAEPALVVGWHEHVGLPEWGIEHIRTKVDTGARTSAVHVSNIQRGGGGLLSFDVVIHERPHLEVVRVEAEEVRRSHVKPSSGRLQNRPVVRTLVQVGPISREIELSLVGRKGMLCRMLLGRTAMEGILVDPTREYVVSERPEPKRRDRPRKRRGTGPGKSPKGAPGEGGDA